MCRLLRNSKNIALEHCVSVSLPLLLTLSAGEVCPVVYVVLSADVWGSFAPLDLHMAAQMYLHLLNSVTRLFSVVIVFQCYSGVKKKVHSV